MRRILIADDERIERQGIKFLLKQYNETFIIEEAVHGKAALSFLKQQKIDILLTDIKMPFLDGLELVKEALNLYPDLKCVIFSGFSEFEFAKQAMVLGVTNYILKPVDPEELERTMYKVLEELDWEEEKQKIHKKEQNFIYEHFLYQLVNGVPFTTLKEQMQGYIEEDMQEEYSCMILLESNHDFFERVNDFFETELYKELKIPFHYLNLTMQQSLLFIKKGWSLDYAVLGQHLHNYIAKQYKEDCYVAVSQKINQLQEISERFHELEQLIEYKFYDTNHYVFLEGEELKALKDTSDETLMGRILSDIENYNIEGIKQNYECLCERYKGQTNFSQVYVKFIFSSIMKEISTKLSNLSENKLNKEVEEVYLATKIQEVIEITNRYIRRLEESILDSGVREDIHIIKNYIYEHFQSDISVEQLAAEVCLTPSYVSAIFKKETGCNLSKFIKSYRMEKAKEYLKTTRMKVVEVCEHVGYSNVSYFCQNFKEYYGMSPEKFRQIIRK